MSCNILTESGLPIIIEDGSPLIIDGACIIEQNITWQTGSYVYKDLDVIYDVGQGILKWYRVQGTCVPCAYNNGCETTGLQVLGTQCLAGTTGAQFYIQNIIATSVVEVCNILKESKLNWEVCTIKVYSRPADPALSGPEDVCNTLYDVPFEDLPECLPIYVQEKASIKMKMAAYVVEANFDVTSSGGILTGGEATYTGSTGFGSSFECVSSGLPSLVIGSETEYNSSWDSELLISTKMNVTLDFSQAVLNYQENNPALTNSASSIRTTCGSCTSMPSLIYAFHNFTDVLEIKNFLNKNNVEFPNKFLMRYSRLNKSWVANHHMIGEGSSGVEKWNFNFHWQCTDYDAEEYVSPFWKFSIFINKSYLDLNLDFDTKIHIVFPPDYLCERIDNLLFDFPFTLNTLTEYVANDFVRVTEDVVLTDNIGLFKNNLWKSNPLLDIVLSSRETQPLVETKDLTLLIP